jgi:AcrR family transcriptional regulator
MDAAARRIASTGAAALSLGDIARDAGVSKALIHYHFQDKESLLARLISHLADTLVEREQRALAPFEGQHNPLAVDALWDWLERELRRGDIRVLLELDSYRGTQVQAAAREAAGRRHAAAEETIARLFRILDLKPRIEVSLLANVVVAFIDGLAIGARVESGESSEAARSVPTSCRVAFDVFWLAMLSLAE